MIQFLMILVRTEPVGHTCELQGRNNIKASWEKKEKKPG